MKFSDVFRVQKIRVFPSKDGKPPRAQVEVACFGATFSLWVPDRFVPRLKEGCEVKLELALRPGKFGAPEVYLSDVA